MRPRAGPLWVSVTCSCHFVGVGGISARSVIQTAWSDAPRSRRPGRRSLGVVDATELFDGLSGLAGSRDTGATNGIAASRLVNGVEYAHAATMDERRLRAAWKRRWGGG